MVDGQAQIPHGAGLDVEPDSEMIDRFLWRG
jgi:hypothetical protein